MGWKPIRGHLTNIAVGSASHIWGVNADQRYQYDGPNIRQWVPN